MVCVALYFILLMLDALSSESVSVAMQLLCGEVIEDEDLSSGVRPYPANMCGKLGLPFFGKAPCSRCAHLVSVYWVWPFCPAPIGALLILGEQSV